MLSKWVVFHLGKSFALINLLAYYYYKAAVFFNMRLGTYRTEENNAIATMFTSVKVRNNSVVEKLRL